MERNGISVTLNVVWLLIPDELDRVLQGFTDTTISRVYRGSFNAFLLKTGNWGYNSHSSQNAARAHGTQMDSKFTRPQEPLGCGAAGFVSQMQQTNVHQLCEAVVPIWTQIPEEHFQLLTECMAWIINAALTYSSCDRARQWTQCVCSLAIIRCKLYGLCICSKFQILSS